MTVGELQDKLSAGESLFIDEHRLEWGRAGEGAPIMDASECFWYATGSWCLKERRDRDTHIQIHYPRLIISVPAAPPGCEVMVQGLGYRLVTQDTGVCEKDLLARGCLPTALTATTGSTLNPFDRSAFFRRRDRTPEDAQDDGVDVTTNLTGNDLGERLNGLETRIRVDARLEVRNGRDRHAAALGKLGLEKFSPDTKRLQSFRFWFHGPPLHIGNQSRIYVKSLSN